MLSSFYIENKNDFTFDISIHRMTTDVSPHGHSFIEIHYVFEGQGIEKINGIQHAMKPGTFAVIFPHQVHEMHIEKGSKIVLYNLCLSAETLFSQDESGLAINKLLFDIDLNPTTIYNLDVSTSQNVYKILSEMYCEFNEENIWKNLMLKAKIIELFILFDRYRRLLIINEDDNVQGIRKNDAWTIIHYVYKNSNENITLNSLSKLFYLSMPYISTIFKKCLGISFHDFLRDLRIENACSLLTSSKMSITDITYEVGYSSYSTFARVFHTRKGVSPAIFRQQSNSSYHSYEKL